MAPLVVLVGPPGAGKSTVGRAAARRLDVALCDTDSDIVDRAGKSIADIFVEDGEAAFREMEREAVAAALEEHDGVVSLGGGAVLDAGTRVLLRKHRVVYLSVGLSEGLRRVGFAQQRPVLALNPRAQYRHLLEQRRPWYEEVATVTVRTDEQDLASVVDTVVAAAAAGSLQERG